jgi:predicted DNA-binding WGR domain protein
LEPLGRPAGLPDCPGLKGTPISPHRGNPRGLPGVTPRDARAEELLPRTDQDYFPVQHTIVLRRVDAAARTAHFYVLTLERDLFGSVLVTRQWGRVGTAGRQITAPYPTEEAAVEAMTALAAAKRRRGYNDL